MHQYTITDLINKWDELVTEEYELGLGEVLDFRSMVNEAIEAGNHYVIIPDYMTRSGNEEKLVF